jgi:multidrug transporter EmrE-like cation transporter
MIPVFLYIIIKENRNISTVNIIWNILSTIYGLIIGVLIFQEKIHTLQIYGVLLGVLGIGLIFWKQT